MTGPLSRRCVGRFEDNDATGCSGNPMDSQQEAVVGAMDVCRERHEDRVDEGWCGRLRMFPSIVPGTIARVEPHRARRSACDDVRRIGIRFVRTQ